jgi:transposase
LPANHRVRWLEEFIDGLDLSSLWATYRGVGSEAHRPDLMFKIVLYQAFEGRLSPASWAKAVPESIPLLWLGRGIQPSRTALYNFRDRVGDVIQDVHATMVRQAIAQGLIDPKEGVQDGTTIRACASRHRTINRKVLARRQTELQAVIAQDEAGQSPATVPKWMAQTRRGRPQQSEQYAKAREALEGRLAENARRPKGKRLDENQVTISVSDPEAPLGRDKEKVYCPLYTPQLLVEPDSRVPLAFEVFAQATDAGTLPPLLDAAARVTGRQLEAVAADAAYATLLDLQECAKRNVELFAPVQENGLTEKKRAQRAGAVERIGREAFRWLPEERTYTCPQGHRLDYLGKESKRRRGDQKVVEYRYHCAADYCRNCPLRDRCVRDPDRGRTVKRLEGQELLDAHRAKMKTADGQAHRQRRGQIIERHFGDAKEHRHLRRLHGRGIHRARAEIGLVVLAQTALAIKKLREARATAQHTGP